MIKVRALLDYVYTTTYNRINWNWPRVFIMRFYKIVWFNTQRRFHASMSARVSNSIHPVTYTSQFCRKRPGHKIYHCTQLQSTRHYRLLHNPTILHTKTFFAPDYHLCQIYRFMSAWSTGHHTLPNNPTILHSKKKFAPACCSHKKISSTSRYN